MMAHFHYTFAGFPLVTYNKYTVVPAFLIHFFSGRLFQNWRLLARGLIIPLFLYQFVMFIMVWRSAPLTQTFQWYLENEVMPILLFLIIVTTEWKRRDIIRFVWIIFGTMQLVGLIAVYEHHTHIPVFFSFNPLNIENFPHRPNGTYYTVAILNTVFSIGLFLVVPVVLKARSLAGRIYGWGGIGLIMYTNLIAFYRGIQLPLLLLLPIFILRSRSRRGKALLGIIIVVIGLASYSIQITQTRTYQERVTEVSTINIRFATYLQSIKVIAEKPFVGWGLYKQREALGSLSPSSFRGSFNKDTPHNTFLMFWIETGAIGLGVLLFWLIVVFRHLWRNYTIATTEFDKDFLFGGVLAFIQFFLLNMTLSSWTGTSNIFLFLIVGLQMVYFRTFQTEAATDFGADSVVPTMGSDL
jgi:O-antigen ligase